MLNSLRKKNLSPFRNASYSNELLYLLFIIISMSLFIVHYSCTIHSAGMLNRGVLTGRGKMTYPDGRIEEGHFSNGELTKDLP